MAAFPQQMQLDRTVGFTHRGQQSQAIFGGHGIVIQGMHQEQRRGSRVDVALGGTAFKRCNG